MIGIAVKWPMLSAVAVVGIVVVFDMIVEWAVGFVVVADIALVPVEIVTKLGHN